MIIDFLVSLFLGILLSVLGLLPETEIWHPPGTSSLGTWHQDWAFQLGSMLKLWDLFFPIMAFITCVLVIVGAKLFVALTQFVLFIWDKLPFKSS